MERPALLFARVATWFNEKRGLAFCLFPVPLAPLARCVGLRLRNADRVGGCAALSSSLGRSSLCWHGDGVANSRASADALLSGSCAPFRSTVEEGLRSAHLDFVRGVVFVSIGHNGANHAAIGIADGPCEFRQPRGPGAAAMVVQGLIGSLDIAGSGSLFCHRGGSCAPDFGVGAFLLALHESGDGNGILRLWIRNGGEACDSLPARELFRVRSSSTLFALDMDGVACAGAIGPVIMGTAFDASTGSIRMLVVWRY